MNPYTTISPGDFEKLIEDAGAIFQFIDQHNDAERSWIEYTGSQNGGERLQLILNNKKHRQLFGKYLGMVESICIAVSAELEKLTGVKLLKPQVPALLFNKPGPGPEYKIVGEQMPHMDLGLSQRGYVCIHGFWNLTFILIKKKSHLVVREAEAIWRQVEAGTETEAWAKGQEAEILLKYCPSGKLDRLAVGSHCLLFIDGHTVHAGDHGNRLHKFEPNARMHWYVSSSPVDNATHPVGLVSDTLGNYFV